MVVYLIVYKMAELCLPWTWGCSLLRSFQQSPGVKLGHCGQKTMGDAVGKAFMDKKCFITWPLSLVGLNSDLAEWSHSAASMRPKAWTCSAWAPVPNDACSFSRSGTTMLSIRWSRWNVAQLHLWSHFPTPPYPTVTGLWHAISATLLSQWLVWGLSGRACGEPSPSFFCQDKFNFTSSGLIKPLVSKIVTQPLGELNLSLPSLDPPSWK